ncbi:MAG: rhodanese-like domain-containing protein [Candidatus Ventricola sp.]|nr:rhodanese-like domain-containing protein [Candidatus Ventricola sp.]
MTVLLLTGCAARPSAGTYHQITAQEAAELMESETGYIVLDVRTPEEYAGRHIPGAINVPNETIGSTAPEQLPDREQLILIYCRSGNRSKQAADKLVALGYTNIVEFGGISSWSGETVSGGE